MVSRVMQPVAEILELYRLQFVLLEGCRFDERGRVTHASVVAASPDREVVYEKLRDHDSAIILFAGPHGIDHDGAFLDSGDVWVAINGEPSRWHRRSNRPSLSGFATS